MSDISVARNRPKAPCPATPATTGGLRASRAVPKIVPIPTILGSRRSSLTQLKSLKQQRPAFIDADRCGSGGRRSIQLSYWRDTNCRLRRLVEDGGGWWRLRRTSTNLHPPPPPSITSFSQIGASGFEPPTSWSRTRRANRAALRPELPEAKGLRG